MWKRKDGDATHSLIRWTCAGILLGIVLLARTEAPCCGPHFPNRLLVSGDTAVLSAPVASFQAELMRLLPRQESEFTADRSRDPSTQTAAADREELWEVLRATVDSENERQALIDWHDDFRKAVRGHREWKEMRRNPRRYRAPVVPPGASPPRAGKSPLEDIEVPSGLPDEFRHYLSGALHYHRGEMKEARAEWLEALDRPANERRYRSTWAAYMMGRSYIGEDSALVKRWMRITRDLVQQGFADSLHLAATSLGWEARAALDETDYLAALELYIRQLDTGGTDYLSIQFTIGRLFRSPQEDRAVMLLSAAHHPRIRPLITAFLASTREGGYKSYRPRTPEEGDSRIDAWISALERAGIEDVEGADRLAWTAYRWGRHEATARWLERSSMTPLARWTRAKLHLRAGRLEEAARELAAAARSFPESAGWSVSWDEYFENQPLKPPARMHGELGVIHLSRGEFTRALDLLIRGGYWWDAGYVAERVLTIEELIAYVDRHHTGAPDTVADDAAATTRRDDKITGRLRYLLARRLARLGRWTEARSYYPDTWQGRLDSYLKAWRRGEDPSLSRAERSAALWEAARIARHEGFELFGTEVEPDWVLLGGSYRLAPFSEERDKVRSAIVPATREELTRAGAHRPSPDIRFHYRYRAADHAWAAARIMPDDSLETAKVLCTAGSWLKSSDPKAADRFYKALVRRCRGTELGRQADELRWFPKLSEAGGG